jgi:hypothetical protein
MMLPQELRAPVIGGQRPGHPPVLANAVPDLRPFTAHRNPATPLVDPSPSEELDRVVRSRVASAAVAGFELSLPALCCFPDCKLRASRVLGEAQRRFRQGHFPWILPQQIPDKPRHPSCPLFRTLSVCRQAAIAAAGGVPTLNLGTETWGAVPRTRCAGPGCLRGSAPRFVALLLWRSPPPGSPYCILHATRMFPRDTAG